MDAEKIFAVETLTKEESWFLFKAIVGPEIEDSDVNLIAREVAAECGGLPIAILTVARALKDKNKFVWSNAARQLKKSTPTDIQGMEGNVFSLLELSFNHLEAVEAKSLLLFCSLFPEDYKILVEDLVRYGMGLKWFKDVESVDDARLRTYAIVSTLTSSFLLIDENDCENGDAYVKMHDVIRDFALTIAPKCNNVFMVKAGIDLQEWPARDAFEDLTCISLMSNNIRELPNGLLCPNLQTLLLRENPELVIPENFFLGMKDLKVLDLSQDWYQNLHRYRLLRMPESHSSLVNLRKLNLRHCKCDDFSVVGKLSKLEILNLQGCGIEEIPLSFSQLSYLRLLDLRQCWSLTLIPQGSISSLRKLEELYMEDSSIQWNSEGGVSGSNASLVEFQYLSQLTSLQLRIPNPDVLPKDAPFQNLSRFILRIGSHDHYWETSRYTRKTSRWSGNIMLSCRRILKLLDWVKKLLERTENLALREISDNSEHILDGLTFRNLEELSIFQYPSLVEIHPPAQSFSKLKILKVAWYHSMVSIVPNHLLPRLQNLKYVEARYGKSLVSVFSCEKVENANGDTQFLSSLQFLDLFSFPNLLDIWKGDLKFISLHNLKIVRVEWCPKLMKLFPRALLQSLIRLEEIAIDHCKNLEEIFEKKQMEDQRTEIIPSDSSSSSSLGNLTSLYIRCCDKLKILLTTSIVKNLVKLRTIKLELCSMIQEIVMEEEGNQKASTERIVFPSLKIMELEDLLNLTCFSSDLYSLEFPALQQLKIIKCPKMKTFCYRDMVAPKLKKLLVWDRDLNATLQQIFNIQANQPGSAGCVGSESEDEE